MPKHNIVSIKRSNPEWAKQIAERVKGLTEKEVVAGFPRGSEKASQTYENGMSVLDVAMVNNFGSTIHHPGGTAYAKGEDGKVRFVSNNDPRASQLPRTSAHTITIPARPFMDEAVKVIEKDIHGSGAAIARDVIHGKTSGTQALNQIAVMAEGAVKEAITSGTYVPNAPSTKREKRSSKPLIDTGKMRQAVTGMVRPAGGEAV